MNRPDPRPIQYRILTADEARLWTHKLSEIASEASMSESGHGSERCGFLGCPLSADDLNARFEIADIVVLAFAGKDCVGYCFGYSSDAFERALVRARTDGWPDLMLFEKVPLPAACVFQDAVRVCYRLNHADQPRPLVVESNLPDRKRPMAAKRHGIGRNLVRLAVDLASVMSPGKAIWGFIPAKPRNYMNYNLAVKLGFNIASTFDSLSAPEGRVASWYILRKSPTSIHQEAALDEPRNNS